MLSTKSEFRENWFSDRHTIREEMYLYPSVPYLLADLGKFWYNSSKTF